ncbi:MAG: hypothetical protein N3B13_04765 [Deltaproteobacteria bacterium]|nr:hypothetical protein [Deltaproteobacteria bacterium]
MILGYIDIHTHIIPDVDDGAKDFEDSIKTIRQLKEQGIDTIIATPHRRSNLFDFNREKIRNNFRELTRILDEQGLEVRLELGAEYYFGADLFEDISSGEVYTLGSSDYILVEFKNLRFTVQDKENLFRIFTSGYRVIVAHIERNRFNSESFSGLDYLRDNSALFQCDIMSLSGLWGEQARLFMEELIKRNYVDIVSTDVHCKDFESDLIERGFLRLSEVNNGLKERCMGDNIKKRLGLI